MTSMMDFSRVEHYDAASLNCYAFCRGTDVKDGITLSLGNMVSGFPFQLNGVEFQNSECAYISGLFSGNDAMHFELQRQLKDCTNGLMAKRAIRRPNKHLARADWEEFNIQWMLYVVWTKCCQSDGFRQLLLSIPQDAVIIEDSTTQAGRTATVWGTRNAELKQLEKQAKVELKAQGFKKAAIKRTLDSRRLGEWSRIGAFVGQNIMGKILMLCRDALRNHQEPTIDYDLLRSKRIYLLGQLLTF